MKATPIVILTLALALTSCKNNIDSDPTAGHNIDTLSWIAGQNLADDLMATGITLDNATVVKAFESRLNGKQSPIDDSTYRALVSELKAQIALNAHLRQKNESQQAAQNEEEYFNKLRKKNKNIVKTPDGIYYEVLKQGTGARPQVGSIVEFDYQCTFTNGQIFDQTYGSRPPIRHVLGNPMFPGLQLGLQLMPVGSKYRFYFPSALAFGATGAEGIPPYSTLIYEVELYATEAM